MDLEMSPERNLREADFVLGGYHTCILRKLREAKGSIG
jgi:hypothetical protein